MIRRAPWRSTFSTIRCGMRSSGRIARHALGTRRGAALSARHGAVLGDRRAERRSLCRSRGRSAGEYRGTPVSAARRAAAATAGRSSTAFPCCRWWRAACRTVATARLVAVAGRRAAMMDLVAVDQARTVRPAHAAARALSRHLGRRSPRRHGGRAPARAGPCRAERDLRSSRGAGKGYAAALTLRS